MTNYRTGIDQVKLFYPFLSNEGKRFIGLTLHGGHIFFVKDLLKFSTDKIKKVVIGLWLRVSEQLLYSIARF